MKTSQLGLSETDSNNYSIFRAIEACITGNWEKAGLEKECDKAIAKITGKGAGGFYMPLEAGGFGQRDLTVGSTTAGGYLKGTDHRSDIFIEALYDRLVLKQLGAKTMSGLIGDISIPAMDTSTSVYWVAEGGAPTEGAPTVKQIAMAPKTVGAYVDITRKLRLQSSPSAEQIFRDDMVRKVAGAVDAVGIEGGGTNQPTGILQTSGIGAVTIGTNGGAPTWSTVVDLVAAVEIDNADEGAMAFLTNPKVKSKLSTTAKVTSTDSRMILDEVFDQLYSFPLAATNGVPSDLNKGSGTDLSALIFGSFNNMIIGQWGPGVEVLVDPYTFSSTGGVRVTCFLDVDIAILHAEAFAACQEIVTT